ncbi:MAG: phasin family protein [Alphaproteobacteria bacterium]|nr:phasin family protein [Alphaproteobacteria bacterium]
MAARKASARGASAAKPAVTVAAQSATAVAAPEMEKPMTPTFKFPFADVDFTKAWGEFKMPTAADFKFPTAFNVEAIAEAQRKNIAVMTTANQAAFEAFKTLAERQAEMVKAMTEDFSKAASEIMAAASFEEKAAKQADVAKKTYETAIANLRELSEMIAKSNAQTLDAVNARVAEVIEEVKALLAKKN